MATIAGDQITATPTSSQFVDTSARNVMQPIKSEPPIDIDEICSSENTTNSKNDATLKPKIRLTPTNKLMAASPSPNKKQHMQYNTNDYQGHPYLSSTTVEGKKKFVCPYENCEKSYGKSSHLRSHLTWHTGIKPFVCHEPSCGKGFTRSDELNRHTRTHTGEKPFECVQCTKKFSRSDHLSKHLVTHAKQLANGGGGGNALSLQKSMPFKRETTTNTLPAMACLPAYAQNMETASTSQQNGQTMLHALKQEASSSTAAAELSNDELIVPVLMPHVEIKEESDDDDDDYDENVNAGNNATHNDDEIMPEANAPPPVASNQLAAVSSLNKTHTSSERPYACDACDKAFRRQDDLTRHKRTHTGEKPYGCMECDRRFMRGDHLKKHMNTHNKNR